uniref:Uncharacterized protein n=1 Tax=Solanum lycopersicum TaxID=4081 RepID=A0A3Q7JA12_SOLLC
MKQSRAKRKKRVLSLPLHIVSSDKGHVREGEGDKKPQMTRFTRPRCEFVTHSLLL